MVQSFNKATMLLMLFSGALALPFDSIDPSLILANNSCGPGSLTWNAGEHGNSGEPKEGYHIRTCDPTKAWDAAITRTDNTKVQNQYIVKDVDPTTTSPSGVDRANGIYGEGMGVEMWASHENYTWNPDTKLWDVPSGNENPTINKDNKNVGHPSNLRNNDGTLKYESLDFVSTMRHLGHLDSEDGVLLKHPLARDDTVGYNSFSEGKDYMLLYFGAEWSPECQEFNKGFAKYYKTLDAKKVGVVYFGHEQTEPKFDASRKTMSFPAARFDADHELIFRLKNVLEPNGQMSIPCVVVIDKAGKVVTTQGVEGIRGDANGDGKYPHELGSQPDLFQKDGAFFEEHPQFDCSIDEEKQKEELIAAYDTTFTNMNELQLRAYAQAYGFKNPASADVETLRKFCLQEVTKVINKEHHADVEKQYVKVIESNEAAQKAKFEAEQGRH